ncbi:MAG: alpha-L-fucosidase [Cyclobacteriaceae bacterium]
MNRIKLIFPTLLFTLLSLNGCKPKPTETNDNPVAISNFSEESQIEFDQRMKWWREARVGMFIHWGIYSAIAGIHNGQEVSGLSSWIMELGHIPTSEYKKYGEKFNPINFDADEWVRTAKNAGMKYIVITSKHHEGFGLWDSNVSDYDVMDFTPYKKDILKSLSNACKKQGIKFGLYYSILDWHHQDAQANSYMIKKSERPDNKMRFARYFEDYMKPQLKEIITQYDPEILWFDGDWTPDFTHEQGLALYQYVRSLKPHIIINNRVDKGRNELHGMYKEDQNKYAGDFGTPENVILENTSSLDWESCMTMNDTWGYKTNDNNWKSARMLIHDLIDVNSKGGNYLLNVGPTAEGIIPRASTDRLAEIGKWMKINNEAIYATEALQEHFKENDNIRYTKKKGKDIIYAISLEKPGPELVLKYVKPENDSKIFLLGNNNPLKWTYQPGTGLKISISETDVSGLEAKYAWTFKITGKEQTAL